MDIKIDKDIPMPPRWGQKRTSKVAKYDDVLTKLQIGESFQVCGEQEITNVRNCIMYHKSKKMCDMHNGEPIVFATRTDPCTENTFRVWRTK